MRKMLGTVIILLLITACGPEQSKVQEAPEDEKPAIQRIAFGSCAHEDKPHPILDVARSQKPDLFIYLGDNVYGDTEDMEVLKAKYRRLATKREFQMLRKATRLMAIWDDHDYGENDAGREYPFKEASKKVFLDFWQGPGKAEREKHAGIYYAEVMGTEDKRVQIILLDTRTFRDKLLPNEGGEGHKNDYRPNMQPDSTFLGESQWTWLEGELRKEAAIRIIASSNQFGHSYNGWESWTNVPHERQRMLDLIHRTQAGGVIFISGDVHWGELSKLQQKDRYPIYDVTSSGITQTWDKPEPNSNRIGQVFMENNFGLISIDWEKERVLLQIRDINNVARVSHEVPFSELQF